MSKALELFTAVPRAHNCAQSVVCGCDRCDLHQAMQNSGGGKAPGGLCGAVYGAMRIVPEKADDILRDFTARFGSAQCPVLKKELHVPCPACVEFSAELAAKYAS